MDGPMSAQPVEVLTVDLLVGLRRNISLPRSRVVVRQRRRLLLLLSILLPALIRCTNNAAVRGAHRLWDTLVVRRFVRLVVPCPLSLWPYPNLALLITQEHSTLG